MDARAIGHGHVVVGQKLYVVVVDVHAMDGQHLRRAQHPPVVDVAHGAGAGRQPRLVAALLLGALPIVRGVGGVHGKRRGTVAHEIDFLAAARHMQGKRQLVLGRALCHRAQDLRVARIDWSWCDAKVDAPRVGRLAHALQACKPVCHHLLGAVGVRGEHLLVDAPAQADLLHRVERLSPRGDVGDGGDAAGHRLHRPDARRRKPVLFGEKRLGAQHSALPLGIWQVVEHAAQRRKAQVRVQVHEARHEGRLAEVAHLLVRMRAHQIGRRAHLYNALAFHEHSAVFDVVRSDRDDVFRT